MAVCLLGLRGAVSPAASHVVLGNRAGVGQGYAGQNRAPEPSFVTALNRKGKGAL